MESARSLLAAIRGPRRAPGRIPTEGRIPSRERATGWLNSPPPTTTGLRGQVVVVDFWTYTCINWLRTEPYVRAWAEEYRSAGAALIGVHTPEFPFERDVDNVRRAVRDRQIRRTDAFASPGRARLDAPRTYEMPSRLGLGQWALAGGWSMRQEFVTPDAGSGRIAVRFHARDVHLVMGPGPDVGEVRVRVLIDGRPPDGDSGVDIDEKGHGTVSEQRLHDLIRQHRPVTDRTLEIEFLDPGIEAFAVTFG
jgi:thiol-disulfide isomerase/thioredoxin